MGEQRPSSPPHRLMRSAIGLSDLPDPPSCTPIGRHVGKVASPTPCPSLLWPTQHFRLRVASLRSPSGRARCGLRLPVFAMDSVRPRAPWAPPPDPASLDSPTCEPGLMAGTQLFRFREEPVPGGNRAVLEVRVPQINFLLELMAHALNPSFNPSIQKAEARGSLEFEANIVCTVTTQ